MITNIITQPFILSTFVSLGTDTYSYILIHPFIGRYRFTNVNTDIDDASFTESILPLSV